MFRFRLMLLVIMILLLPQGVFAETQMLHPVASSNTNLQKLAHAQNLIKRKMRLYHHYNIQVIGDNAIFFAFHKKNHNVPFGWYRLNLKKKFSRAERIISSSEFSLLFRASISPDSQEAVVTSKTGEIFIQNLRNGKKRSLGAYITDLDYPQYSFPTYTPDGKHIIFLDPWGNSLLIVEAGAKDLLSGIRVEGFWLPGVGGSETPEDGSNISPYRFSDDGIRMTFMNGSVLNLETFTKE